MTNTTTVHHKFQSLLREKYGDDISKQLTFSKYFDTEVFHSLTEDEQVEYAQDIEMLINKLYASGIESYELMVAYADNVNKVLNCSYKIEVKENV